MKAVLESLLSYLGRISEDRKPSNNQTDYAIDAGYGSYGFPLLIKRLKSKKCDHQGNPLSRKGNTIPSSRHRSQMHSLLTNSEPNLSPHPCNLSAIEIISSPPSTAARIETLQMCDRSMGLRDCLVKLCSREASARKHVGDQPFDKYTSEYYSCGKKRVQNQRLAFEFSNVDCTSSVDASADSSALYSEVSGSSCAEDNASTQVSGLSIILAENKSLIHHFCHRISEASPISNTNDVEDIAVEVQKISVNGEHLHSRGSECDLGFCSQHEHNDELSSWKCSMSGLSFSPARGAVRKKFPPPLNMVALQSYSDKRAHSPEACAASYCLRSFRQDGRIVLQEVRAPIHKYFRVSREDGRLKLELISVVDDKGKEDDETSASDVCGRVKSRKAEVGTEEICTSNTHAEDTCEGTLVVGMCPLSDETSKNGAGSDIGCVRTDELMSARRASMVRLVKQLEQDELAASDIQSKLKVANAGAVKPLEQVESAASFIQSKLAAKSEAADICSDLGASADEELLQGNLIFANEVGADQDMVSCLNEPASTETMTLYDGSSARMKHSWVCPISAF